MLPAFSLDGILHVRIVEGSFTAARFYDFIDGLLDHMEPFLGNNSVIVMDNARVHKNPAILGTDRRPVSPDYFLYITLI
jgi:hypothetical protein